MTEPKRYNSDIVAMMNNNMGGFNNLMGLRFTRIEPEYIEAELEISNKHTQPYGIVHGGLYCAIIETICSTGAALQVFEEGKSAVGLENTTSFLRAVRSGKLRCIAKPVFTGRRSQVWEAEIMSDQDKCVATGRVRLMILEKGSEVGGKMVELEQNDQ